MKGHFQPVFISVWAEALNICIIHFIWMIRQVFLYFGLWSLKHFLPRIKQSPGCKPRPVSLKLGLVAKSYNTAAGGQVYLNVDGGPGVVSLLEGLFWSRTKANSKKKKRGSLHGAKPYSGSSILTLQMARICSGVTWFMLACLSPSGFPGRKTDAAIGFGLSAMLKAVLGHAWVIRQLENRAYSHSGG